MILEEDKELLLNTLYHYKCFGIEYIDEFDFNSIRNRNSRSTIELPDSYEQLSDFIEHCSLCELSKLTEKKNIGFGNSQSELFFICDSINLKDKNILNILQKIIYALGVSFQEIYITNIIKCSIDLVKENKEKYGDICKDYTLQQIAIKHPKILITFGESWKYFLTLSDNDSICYGKEYNYKGIALFALHDLEFLYKNPSYNSDMEQHIKKIKRYLNGE